MFEHFDERGRAGGVIAQQEARRLGHEEVGTAHVLLGLAAVAPDLLGVPPASPPPSRVPTPPADHAAALRAGGPLSVTLGGDPTPIGDLGHPDVDRRLLELMLVNDTRAARLLRAHGIDETRLRLAFGAHDGDAPA